MEATTTREYTSHARYGRGSLVPWSRGFSLIELLVVIAIIAVLSGIILASLSAARSRGRDGRRVSDIKQIQLALSLYYDAYRQFPADIYGTQLTGGGFIPSMPRDPATGGEYAYVALQGPSSVSTRCLSYHLGALLESQVTAAAAPLGNDQDASPGSPYGPSVNGPVCSGSIWEGSAQIPAVSNDFNGSDPVYDVRP